MLKINRKNHKQTIALIESNRIVKIDEDNMSNMSPIDIEDLPYIPVIVYPIIRTNSNEISYTLKYKLLIPRIDIESIYNEEYIIKDNSSTRLITSLNSTHSPIMYDNSNITTILDIKGNETILNYVMRKRQKLFELTKIINDSIHTSEENKKQKIFTK